MMLHVIVSIGWTAIAAGALVCGISDIRRGLPAIKRALRLEEAEKRQRSIGLKK